MEPALIERLKSYRVSADVNHPVHPTICDEAIQEIKRLESINAELLAACEAVAYLVEAVGGPPWKAFKAAIEKAIQ